MKFHTSNAEEMTSHPRPSASIRGSLPYSDGNSPDPLTDPEKFEAFLADLFTFRTYQKDDLARAAMHDGCILGWDPGMGKTMAIFSLPFLKHARFALIVAPGGLHEQIIDEGREKFGVIVTPLPDQETALRFMREGILPMPGKQGSMNNDLGKMIDEEDSSNSSITDHLSSVADPQFFITSYTALGYNGADEWAAAQPNELLRHRRLSMLRRAVEFPDPELASRMAALTWKTQCKAGDWEILSLPAGSSADSIKAALRTGALLFHPHVRGGDKDCIHRWNRMKNAAQTLLKLSDAAMDKLVHSIDMDHALLIAADALEKCEAGIGTERSYPSSILDPSSSLVDPTHSIKCVFQPTLASLITGIFDFTICDEAVRIKSGCAYQAQGVLRMTGRCRYALTGTAIKNKLPDLFFLASWVTGHTEAAIARWPYGNKMEDRGQFSRDFGVMEENLTKQEKAEENGFKPPVPKVTTQICNVHRLWRILGCVFIGRKKDDIEGCDIVGKTIVPIRVMPGKEQKVVYKFHLDNPPKKKTPLASIGTQLQYLRQAALNPGTCKLPAGKSSRSTSPWTPKHIGILQLAETLLAQGEQLVIFSPFCDFGQGLSDRFTEAGIPHLKLDGETSPKKRGSMIKRFKSGEMPILIAGINSMGEGHNLDTCSHLVLPSLDWAFDTNSQAVDRVHRLTSKKDVTIYVMVTKGTIDERLTNLWQEKGDAADLALYGRLSEHDREEIDLGQLLRDAVKDFDPKAEVLDETEVADQWKSTIRPALTASFTHYRRLRPLKPANPSPSARRETTKPTKKEHETNSSPSCSFVSFVVDSSATRPRTLFDLMKAKRTTAPQPPPTSIPSTFDVGRSKSDVQTPVQSLRTIIPFPGRLGAFTGRKNPVAIPRHHR